MSNKAGEGPGGPEDRVGPAASSGLGTCPPRGLHDQPPGWSQSAQVVITKYCGLTDTFLPRGPRGRKSKVPAHKAAFVPRPPLSSGRQLPSGCVSHQLFFVSMWRDSQLRHGLPMRTRIPMRLHPHDLLTSQGHHLPTPHTSGHQFGVGMLRGQSGPQRCTSCDFPYE